MMQDKIDWFNKNKNKIANIFFYIAFSIELVIMMVEHSAFDVPFRGRLTHIAFALFGCKVLLTKYTKKEWIAIILLGIIGTLSYFSMGDEWVLRIIMMVVASKDISLETVVKYTFWISCIGTIFIMILSLFGIGGQLVDIRHYGRNEVEARWCFGFNHANNIHGTIWYVTSLGIFSYLKKIKWQHCFVLTLGNIGLYFLTVSRAGFIVTQIVIIAAFLHVYCSKIRGWKWVYHLGISATLFCIAISIYSVIFGVYFTPGLKKLSDLLTGRLEMLSWYEKVEYWTLFGDGRIRQPSDVGYITLVAEYGYVILVLYILCIVLLVNYYRRNEKWMEFILLMTCMFYTFMESTYTLNVYLLCNFTFLLLIGTWNKLLTKGKIDEPVQSKI